jgi:hypothetical protein
MNPDLPMALDVVALKATLILVGALMGAFALRHVYRKRIW